MSTTLQIELGTLPEMQKQILVQVLRLCQGNRTKTAEVLGLCRRTISYKLIEYGLQIPSEPEAWRRKRKGGGRS